MTGETLPSNIGENQEKVLDPRVESSAIPLARDYAEKNYPKREDGTFEPAWRGVNGEKELKNKSPEDLIKEGYSELAAHESVIDIANQPYDEYSEYWKEQNRGGAEFLIKLMDERGIDTISTLDLNDEKTRAEYGALIHENWISRNEWVKDPNYGDPKLACSFAELSEEEQQKDIDQLSVLKDWIDANKRTEKADNSAEKEEDEEKIIQESLRKIAESFDIEPSEANLEKIRETISVEARRQEILKEYYERKNIITDPTISELKEAIANNDKKDIVSKFLDNRKFQKIKADLEYSIHKFAYNDWNMLREAEYIRRRNCQSLSIGGLIPKSSESDNSHDIRPSLLQEEAYRRQILSSPEVKKLSKLERFNGTYSRYEEPTLKSVNNPNFDAYLSSEMAGQPITEAQEKAKDHERKLGVEIMNLTPDDNFDQVAEALYLVDQYIFPDLFQDKENAKTFVKALFSDDENALFSYKKTLVAKDDEGNIIGVVVFRDENCTPWDTEAVRQRFLETGLELPDEFDRANEKYMKKITDAELPKGAAEIEFVGVVDDWRSNGIGGRLMKAVMDRDEYTEAHLDVLDSHPGARRLYDKLGFRPQGEKFGNYPDATEGVQHMVRKK